jgi:hypothetical protein
MAMTLREEIAMAVQIGFTEAGGRVDVSHEDTVTGDWVTGTVTLLHVDGFDEPIQVHAHTVIVPECFGELASAINLDVRAVLAAAEDEAW